MACVDLPALSLQLLLRRHPEWKKRPVALVAEENPLSPLLQVNEAARRLGILPGLRYAAGLSLDSRLCAGTVGADELAGAMDELQRLLLRFSPEVEPATDEPGVFWLNAGGLARVHGPLPMWAGTLHAGLRSARYVASLTVGFTRFGVYSLARVTRGVLILESRQDEARARDQVPLARLGLAPRLREDLARLGITTVGEFLALPAAGLLKRFGPAAERLHRMARDELFAPLQPQIPPEPDRVTQVLDDAESNTWRLLFLIKRLLHPLLNRLADRQQAAARLHLELKLADRRCHREELQPATPTLDAVLLLELTRLRLENISLAAGVETVTLELEAADAPPEALALFREHPGRDARAGLRALARLRAEFGDQAVRRAVLRDGHLPDAGFSWDPVDEFRFPTPVAVSRPPLVRRLLPRPRPLPADPAVDELRCGSYRLSGGWWHREVRRIYCFIEKADDELLWIYFDQLRRRWFLQGWVE